MKKKMWTRTCDLSNYCTCRVGIPKEVETTLYCGVKAVCGGNTMKRHRQAVHGVGTKVAGGYWVAIVAVPSEFKRFFDLKPFLLGRAPVPVPATPHRRVCVCVRVRARARACVCVCARMCGCVSAWVRAWVRACARVCVFAASFPRRTSPAIPLAPRRATTAGLRSHQPHPAP